MRTLFSVTLLALAASAGASAKETCNLDSLQGQFVFTGRGFIEAAQPGIQRVHYGTFVFDGAGPLDCSLLHRGFNDSFEVRSNDFQAPTRWTPTAPAR